MQPPQYLRLENSKDGGAWRAAVHGLSESGTTDYGLSSTGLEEPFSAFSPPQLCSLFSGRVCGVPGSWALSPVTGVGSGIGSQWEAPLLRTPGSCHGPAHSDQRASRTALNHRPHPRVPSFRFLNLVHLGLTSRPDPPKGIHPRASTQGHPPTGRPRTEKGAAPSPTPGAPVLSWYCPWASPASLSESWAPVCQNPCSLPSV